MDAEKFSPLVRQTRGCWISGKHAGTRAVLADVRVGMIHTRDQGGTLMAGHPREFAAESGESGDDLLVLSMPRPAWRGLFQGAVRESLAAARSVARIGTQDTHAWEEPIRYVADDNQGNVGIIEFVAEGAVAAISWRAPRRPLDYAQITTIVPPALQDALHRVCNLPLLMGDGGASTVFWTVGNLIDGPEPWHKTYLFGAELFRRELLPNLAWETEGAIQYGLTPELAHLASAISERAAVRRPLVELSREELAALVPGDSKHREEALDLLFSDGLFDVSPT